MKKLFWAMICLAIGIYSMQAEENKGEIQLKGQVLVEETKEDIPYVTITVQRDDAQVVTRQASDEKGRFSIKLKESGKYDLILSAVGYSTTTQSITIEKGEALKDVGKITMKEGVELKEVSIVVQKPLIKSDPDKLVYSVEADPESQSNTLMEMLRKVPLLSVDSDGEVTLNGQSNFKVLVNGKTSSLMSNNFKEVIKSMPASSIKDIEVITNPSSKYEAEGVGGIINIITSKNTTNGYTGSVGLNADSRGGYGANAYISANINKFSFSTNIFSYQFRQPETESSSNRIDYEKVGNDYKIEQYLNSEGKRKVKGGGNSLNFEASYEIDTFNLISASAWGYLGEYRPKGDMISEFRDPDQNPTLRYLNKTDPRYGYGYLSGNIDYQRSFAKKDKTLTASYKIDYNPNNTKTENNIIGELNFPTYRKKQDNQSYGQSHTFQLDYFDPLTEMHQFETGIKGIYRQNFSETDLYLHDNEINNWVTDTTWVNDLDYKQYIMGAYAGYQIKLKKSSIKGGMRAEYTWNDGIVKSREYAYFKNTFFNLIPYINFTYSLKPAQTIKASYTQRIYRPGIWQLNPYPDRNDPMNISYGNPELEAETAHSFALSYGQFSPKFNFNIELNSNLTDNSIQRYSYLDDDAIRNTTFKNMGSNQRHGANLYTSYRPTGKFSINLNGRVNYSVLDAKIREDLKIHNEGFTVGGNLNTRLEAWKGGSINLNGGGGSGWIMLQGKSNGYYYHSLGVNQKLLKDKLEVSASINDPFTKRINFISEYDKDPTYYARSKDHRLGQTVRISVTYRFGKMNAQVKKARRGIKNDDQQSGGGQEGGGGQGGGGQ